MSWQAQTAVTRHSQQTKLQPYKLLHLLAERADKLGVIDPAPSQPTLAIELDCSDRMIRNYLDTLIESGELEQSRVGSGPGRPSAYRILLEMPTEGQEQKPPAVAPPPDDRLSNLEAKVEELTTIISIFTAKVEAMVEKVEGKGGNDLDELGADIPVLEPEEEDKTPLTPQGERPTENPKAAVLTIPEKLNTPEFLEEWEKWMAYKGKKIKQATYQGQLDKLAKEPVEFATARLELSRLNEWKGLWFAGEKPIVINGRTADGQVYQNGHGPRNQQKPTPGLPVIVSDGRGW